MSEPRIGIVLGKIKIRGDDGETIGLGPIREFIKFEGNYYELSCLTSTPPIMPHQMIGINSFAQTTPNGT